MKKKNIANKVISLSTAFLMLGASLASNIFRQPVRTEAAQHTSNYAEYTYSGNYYDGISFTSGNGVDGMDGSLRQALTSLIFPKGWYEYSGSGSNKLSTILQKADEDPTNSNNMVYLYTRDSVTKNAASSWNREHVWPRSLGPWEYDEAGTDILHIRPTYNKTNEERGNDKYGNTNNSTALVYEGMTYGYSNGTYFEPLDSVKGDVARIVMYLWVAYQDFYSSSFPITNVFESYNTLLSWHTMDKPDVLEGNRNNYSESSTQKNRNPFVDHPEAAWLIFGDNASSSVKSACQQTYPLGGSSSGDPVAATGISVSPTSLSLQAGQTSNVTATLTPSNATNTVSWTSNNAGVATVSQSGVVTAVSAGTATITAAASTTIKATCIVTVTGSSTPTSDLEVASSIAVGDVMYLACNDASMQYNGHSTSGTIYGLGASFTNKPSTDGIAFDIVAGSDSNTYAFKIKSGTNSGKYLYWTSGNSLNVNGTLNNKTSWSVSFDSSKNAIIQNASDSSRRIWWNIGAPRFAAYAVSNAGTTYYPVQLWKLTEQQLAEPVLEDYLSNITSIMALQANEDVESGVDSVTFSSLSLANGTAINGLNIGHITITGSQGTNDDNTLYPKYATSGSAVRIYNGNTLTFTADGNRKITKIEFTISSGYSGDNISPLTNNTWTGVASSITFTANAQVRFTAVKVYFEELITLDSVALRFGTKVAEADWQAIKDNWGIVDYGVMLIKAEQEYTSSTFVQDLLTGTKKPEIFNKKRNGAAYADPYHADGYYSFTVKINLPENYNPTMVYYAAPFICVGTEQSNEYKFLNEKHGSVSSIASDYITYGGSDLSSLALSVLAGN